MNDSLRATRLRLTGWYVGVFALVLGLFAVGLYVTVSREIGRTVRRNLEVAVDGAVRAVEIREQERGIVGADLVDALDELHVPGHDIYVFDGHLRPLRPEHAPDWVADAARESLSGTPTRRRVETAGERSWELYARGFEVGEARYAAVAVADAVEVERQYPALLSAFLAAGLAALALVAVGGSVLARQSLIPVERSLERMRRFVADASHELRTPAAVLRAAAEVGLGRVRTPEDHARILRDIRDEAERLGQVVDGLLLLAAADDGRLSPGRSRVFLDDAMVEAAGAIASFAEGRGVSVEVGDFEEAPVDGEPILLRQLLLIVLDNAVKFSPAGATVTCSVVRHSATASACVQDRGPGIAAEALPHVFERFYRADPAREGSGAGIGLSIARTIAEAHGAQLELESTPGRGTRVCVTLPLRES